MPFKSQKAELVLTVQEQETLEAIIRSRTSRMHRIERARILLSYAKRESLSSIARNLDLTRAKVERCINKALQLGVLTSLNDLPGRGKKRTITAEAKTWLLSLACQKPKELGYAQELWTTRLLAQHIRRNCGQAGHPSLCKLGRGTVSKFLAGETIQPHKVRYYVEKRDPNFEEKMAQVLCVYKQVELYRKASQDASELGVFLSYDEKPGMQALESTGQELPPVPGQHSSWMRDYEYVRHGTLSLLAGIDLINGHVHGLVADRHRSREFIEFLRQITAYYPATAKIRMILDNHSAHISKETRAYLATVPNRFEFIFTPKHGSWLNLIETFFAKMAKTLLRGIRVSSKEELKERIEKYFDEINALPVIFRWRYKLDTFFQD
jgi:transposase